MEQTKTVPSLTKLSLISLAHHVKKEKDNNKNQLFTIFDKLKSIDLFQRFEDTIYSTAVSKSDLPFPDAISPDKLTTYYKDSISKKDYLGTLNNPKKLLLHQKPNHAIHCDGIGSPAFSPDNQFAIGRNDFGELSHIDGKTGNVTTFIGKFLEFYFDFLPNGTLIFRNAKSLYSCRPSDLVMRGENGLTQIYTRSDNNFYPCMVGYKALYIISNSSICCVGPQKNSFEIIKETGSTWQLLRIIATTRIIDIGYAQFLPIFAIKLLESNNNQRHSIDFYNLGKMESKSDPIESSSLDGPRARMIYLAPTLSQDGTCCAYVTEDNNIAIINCKNIKQPFIAFTVPIPTIFDSTIFWHDKTIYAKNKNSGRLEVSLAVLKQIDEYKKSAPNKKRKEPDSNNNNTVITDSL